MLAIRLQRTGRSGHSQFRLIAQDSRFSPKRGRVVAYLGSYDPHTKEAKFDSEKIGQYLSNGAQPSDSAAKLMQKEGIKLPVWVKTAEAKQGTVRNPEKRRSTRPAEPKAAATEPEAGQAEETETPAETKPDADELAAQANTEPAAEAAEPEAPAEAEAKPSADTAEVAAEPAAELETTAEDKAPTKKA